MSNRFWSAVCLLLGFIVNLVMPSNNLGILCMLAGIIYAILSLKEDN